MFNGEPVGKEYGRPILPEGGVDPFSMLLAAFTKATLRVNPLFNEMNRWAAEGRYALDDAAGLSCRCQHCMEQRARRFREWYGR